MKVNLVERESNKLQKRVGFSFWYFFLGPIYLLVRLRWEAILFILLYYYLLPIPGLDLFIKYLLSRGVNPQFIYNIEGFALFFKHDWMSFNNYLGVILFAILHIAMSFRCDNWLLSKKLKKERSVPGEGIRCENSHILPRYTLQRASWKRRIQQERQTQSSREDMGR